MSIRTVDVGRSVGMSGIKDIFSFIIEDQPSIEAPDFYTSITVRSWGSGVRTRDEGGSVRYQEIDYDESATFTREPASKYYRPGVIFSLWSPQGTVDKQFSHMPSGIHPDAGKMTCMMQRGMSAPSGQVIPYIGRHYLKFFFHELRSSVLIGTQTIYPDVGPDVVTDIFEDFFFDPPVWGNTVTPTNPREPYDELRGGGMALDISGISNWRDIRGTYTGTESESLGIWDTNTVVRNASVAIS